MACSSSTHMHMLTIRPVTFEATHAFGWPHPWDVQKNGVYICFHPKLWKNGVFIWVVFLLKLPSCLKLLNKFLTQVFIHLELLIGKRCSFWKEQWASLAWDLPQLTWQHHDKSTMKVDDCRCSSSWRLVWCGLLSKKPESSRFFSILVGYCSLYPWRRSQWSTKTFKHLPKPESCYDSGIFLWYVN